VYELVVVVLIGRRTEAGAASGANDNLPAVCRWPSAAQGASVAVLRARLFDNDR